VVGNGIKAQAENPEVKVKEADPVINQVIDKLKHINQVSLARKKPSNETLNKLIDDPVSCVANVSGQLIRADLVSFAHGCETMALCA